MTLQVANIFIANRNIAILTNRHFCVNKLFEFTYFRYLSVFETLCYYIKIAKIIPKEVSSFRKIFAKKFIL